MEDKKYSSQEKSDAIEHLQDAVHECIMNRKVKTSEVKTAVDEEIEKLKELAERIMS